MSTKIDSNFEGVAQADDTSNAAPLKVDPVTGRLLVSVISATSGGIVHTFTSGDLNYERVAIGDDGTNPRPFHTDDNGNLLVDILIE